MLAILAVIGAVAWERCGWRGCPEVSTLEAYRAGGAPRLLDRHGEELGSLSPVGREAVPLDSLPPHVADAFLAVEDRRFYRHGAVDAFRVVGAVLSNLAAGEVREGFSTLTMQLARNVFPARLPARERTVARKLLEIRIARDIERRFGKDEILELYLNHIYFGGGARGIDAAANHYFAKPASRLTLPEAALLAAIPKAPTHYDPRKSPERALARRNLVLGLMQAQGLISAEDVAEAFMADLGVTERSAGGGDRDEDVAGYFADAVRDLLERELGGDLYSGRLRIHTTLDLDLQRAAEEELDRQLRWIEQGGFGRFGAPRYDPAEPSPETGTDYLQGAVVVLGVEGGDVLAWVGGRDFRHSPFDRASRGFRHVGSAFKPFVAARALEEGVALSQPLRDRPLRLEGRGTPTWRPRNHSGTYRGETTFREAVVHSLNVPMVHLAAEVGTTDVAETAGRLGLAGEMPTQLSLALGAVPASPLEMARAYSAFASGGELPTPRLVLRVEDEAGREVWSSAPRTERVLSREVAFLVTDLLREGIEGGTGRAVRTAGFRGAAAGKTGTTNDGRDAWFVGYTPRAVGAVWIGFDRPRSIVPRASGGRLAAPVWGRAMGALPDSLRPHEGWEEPPGVARETVDPATGHILAEGCRPRGRAAREEYFIRGFEVAAACPTGGGSDDEGTGGRFASWVGEVLGRVFGRGDEEEPEEAQALPTDSDVGVDRLPRRGEGEE